MTQEEIGLLLLQTAKWSDIIVSLSMIWLTQLTQSVLNAVSPAIIQLRTYHISFLSYRCCCQSSATVNNNQRLISFTALNCSCCRAGWEITDCCYQPTVAEN